MALWMVLLGGWVAVSPVTGLKCAVTKAEWSEDCSASAACLSLTTLHKVGRQQSVEVAALCTEALHGKLMGDVLDLSSSLPTGVDQTRAFLESAVEAYSGLRCPVPNPDPSPRSGHHVCRKLWLRGSRGRKQLSIACCCYDADGCNATPAKTGLRAARALIAAKHKDRNAIINTAVAKSAVAQKIAAVPPRSNLSRP